jgi:glycopeptide antibiotics resistance protein
VASFAAMRLLMGFVLAAWLWAGLLLTLGPGHPLPGQVVNNNLVPFRTIGIYLANLDDPFWVGQLLGNVALLLPVGLVGPLVFPFLDRWWWVGLLALAASVLIEAAQLGIADRSADVDDVLVNVLGALLGYATWRVLSAGAPRSRA